MDREEGPEPGEEGEHVSPAGPLGSGAHAAGTAIDEDSTGGVPGGVFVAAGCPPAGLPALRKWFK
jgi:hypothetical protein